jgi:hypothetical protein
MSVYWPDNMKVDPIGVWPGELTRSRQYSPFRAALGETLTTLERELRMLGAKDARLQIAIPASRFRLDGRPYADAKPEHPGIILTCESKKRGEQYRGFLALEATAAPAGFATAQAATDWLLEFSGWMPTFPGGGIVLGAVLRAAQRKAHPDAGGDAATFQRVSLAEAVLRREGRLCWPPR